MRLVENKKFYTKKYTTIKLSNIMVSIWEEKEKDLVNIHTFICPNRLSPLAGIVVDNIY